MSNGWHQVQDADSPASCKYVGVKPPKLKFKEYVHHEGKVILGAVESGKKRIHADHAFTECYILEEGVKIFHASNVERKDLVTNGIQRREAPADDWVNAGTASKLACVGHAYFALDYEFARRFKEMVGANYVHEFVTKKEIHCYPDPEAPNALRTDVKKIEVK